MKTKIEVYPVDWITEFTDFHSDAEDTGYAIVPYATGWGMEGTRWGDVDHEKINEILEWSDDPEEDLIKHFERKGWTTVSTTWRDQSTWVDVVVAVGGDVDFKKAKYAERLAEDYKLWLEGDVFIADHPEDGYSSMFLAKGYDTEEIRSKARKALDMPEDTPVAIFEPDRTTAWQEVAV